MKHFFSIDIGSNTIMMNAARRLSLSELLDRNKLSKNLRETDHLENQLQQTQWKKQRWFYTDYIRFASLGEKMAITKKILPENLSRAIAILKEYRSIIDKHDGSKKIIAAVATSAIREALNNTEALTAMENALKIPINVISGEKEGELTFLGSANHMRKPTIVIDIGGGSTEIIFAQKKQWQETISLPIGAVRWKDRFPSTILKNADMQKNASLEVIEQIAHCWEKLVNKKIKKMQGCSFYAVAGVPTTLCAIEYGYKLSDFPNLDNKILPFETIKKLREEICSFSPEQLEQNQDRFQAIDKNRSEIMAISTIIFESLLNFLAKELNGEKSVSISVRGLRYGLLHLLKKNLTKKHDLEIKVIPS